MLLAILALVSTLIVPSDANKCLDTTAKWQSPPSQGGTGTQSVSFQWSVNGTFISILMTATADDVTSAPQWVGFGLSESGGMVGSDIVTVTYDRATGTAAVQDRHVLWTANEFPDATQDVRNDWTLRCYSADAKSLTAVVTRLLDTRDGQDRAIKNGETPVIYAWGPTASVLYHGANRGGATVSFLSKMPKWTPPADVDNSSTLSFNPPWTLTGTTTQYICQVFDMGTADRHVVAIEAKFIGTPGAPFVHHMLVHVCGSDIAALRQQSLFDNKPYPCQAKGAITSQGQSPLIVCETLMFGGAEGTSVVSYPLDVGILVGSGSRYVVVETHLDNPLQLKNVNITDIVKLHTTSKLRKYNGATLVVGDPVVMMPILPQNSTTLRVGTCTSACTSLFGGPITVFGSLLHMHKYGREIWTTKKSLDTGNISVVDYREFWNFGFQLTKDTNFVVNKGDELNTHCKYTTPAKSSISFGAESNNEMCMDFLLFYPAENAFKICGYGFAGTVCGGTSKIAVRNIFGLNPVEDNVGMGVAPFGIVPNDPPPIMMPPMKSGVMGTTAFSMAIAVALFAIVL